MYTNSNNATYFNSFGGPEKPKKIVFNKNITKNIQTVLTYDSLIREYFSTGFIGFCSREKV